MLSMSRWFVGSSSSRQFAPPSISRQSCRRVRSPPESVPTGWRIWSYRNRNRPSSETASSSYIGFALRTNSIGVRWGGSVSWP